MKKLLLLILLAARCFDTHAQVAEEDYYPFQNNYGEERRPMIEVDTTLFYQAIRSGGDLFGQITDFKFSFVAYRRRGEAYRPEGLSVDGIRVASRYGTALRAMQIGRDPSARAMRPLEMAGGGTDFPAVFQTAAEAPLPTRAISGQFSGRGYMGGVRFSIAEELGRGWDIAAGVQGRTGRDLFVEGVFSNVLTVGVRASKRFGVAGARNLDGATGGGRDRGVLSIVVVAGPEMRTFRSASSREAFSLVGNNLYNPAWGYQDGKVRSARIRREIVPLAMANYRVGVGRGTTISISLAAETGIRKLSSLSWFNARSPLPDNYRSMPSYLNDQEVQADVEAIWRANDTRYTQIDWDGLYAANRNTTDGQSAFALVDRVERVTNLQIRAEGETWFSERLVVRYGVRGGYRAGRHYQQMRDLMDGEHVVDHDYFLVDDDTYSNRYQNNMRDPNRKIRRGDRFGYNYGLRQREAGVGGSIEYRADRLEFRFDIGVSEQAVWRQGYYEKEIFPGKGSYGTSPVMHFTPYSMGASAGYAFSARNHLALSLGVSTETPYVRDLFLNPDYNNRTVARPTMATVYRAELDWNRVGRVVEMRVSVYALRTAGGLLTRRYYDDAAGVFSDMVAARIGTLRYGAEITGVFRLARRWTLSVAGAVGEYKYVDDARVTVYDDADNSLIDNDSRAHMDGCHIGGAPQVAAFAGINYYGPKGWGVRVETAYAGLRYVDPTPLRRTARIGQALAESPEALRIITRQERIGDASSLDVTLFKSFYFDTSRLTIMASVRNVLGFNDQIFSGYESMRVPRIPVGDSYVYRPMASRFTYAYPRTFFVGIYFTF